MGKLYTNLSEPILQNKSYDFGFVFENPKKESPRGIPVLVYAIFQIKHICTCITILKSSEDGKLYLISQIHLASYRGKSLVDYNDLVNYLENNRCNKILQITDLDNPYYNCEWWFEIPVEWWHSILEGFKNVKQSIPRYIDSDVKKAVYINDGLGYSDYRWSKTDLPDSISDNIDTLLNYALLRVKSAYLIR